MIYIEPFGGLANRMRVIASGLWLKEQTKSQLRCVWSENKELNASFDQLFEKIDGLVIIKKSICYKYLIPSIQHRLHKKIIANSINRLFNINYFIRDRDFINMIWSGKISLLTISQNYKNIYIQTCRDFGDSLAEYRKFKPTQELNDIISSIENTFTTNTIGIHIRRTDNIKSIEESPIELFIQRIIIELQHNPQTNFFLSTDDPAIEIELKSMFKDKIIIHDKEFSRESTKGMQDAVIDLYCLSKTSQIFGSHWSSFSEVASRIGNIKLTILKKE